jgi:glycosyltransferase involved in cell wall biosynthesis
LGVSEPHILLVGGDGGYSGVPTYLALLTEALSGHARFTILSDENEGGYDFAAQGGTDHVVVPGLRTTLNPLRAWRAMRRLSQVIDDRRPDLVWAHARMGVLLIRVLAVWRRLRQVPMPPVAITFHGLPFGPGHRPVSAPLSWLAEAVFLRLMPAHHLLFLSQTAAQTYAAGPGRMGGMERHRQHVMQNCSRLNPLPAGKPQENPVIVMTGRSGFQKNHGAAARILAHLPPDVRLVLCGSGTDGAAFRRRFARQTALPHIEVDRRVQFLGPTADIRSLLQQADLFLTTARYEGMPIAAIEAFEAGLPLALSDIPGHAEISAAHPMAEVLRKDHPDQAARQIMDLLNRYRDDPFGCNKKIRIAWQRQFSFAFWREGMIALTGRMAGMRPDRAAVKDVVEKTP